MHVCVCVCVYTLYCSTCTTHNRNLPSNKTVVLGESLLLKQSINQSIANSALLLQIDDGSQNSLLKLYEISSFPNKAVFFSFNR